MWNEKFYELKKEKQLYDEKVNIGATKKEIELLEKNAENELNVILQQEYIQLLEKVDRLEFNGFILYGY